MSLSPAEASAQLTTGKIRTFGIVGLGLLGGSLALQLKRCLSDARIYGLARRRESVSQALQHGIIDQGSVDPQEVLPHVDLTIICTPVSTIIDLATANAELWHKNSIVTDVGSVKGEIVETLTPLLEKKGVHFVGSHPMAGSEKSGLAHATPDLYQNSTVLITPDSGTDTRALALVRAMWCATGATTIEMNAAVHDRALGRTSHLIHLLAAAAVDVCLENQEAVHTTGGGFRDFTRIAASSPEMWCQIFEMNRDSLLEAVRVYQDKLQTLHDWVESKDWDRIEAYFARTGAMRTNWFQAWTEARQQNEHREST